MMIVRMREENLQSHNFDEIKRRKNAVKKLFSFSV
jgi:hypothetical protein